jgi:aspartyl protease family protein
MFQKLALLATVAAGIAIGLLWPSSDKSASAHANLAANDVVIARSDDRHYYADASVNGRPVHFMIDTGAGETALTEADAKSIGINVDPANYEVIGDGASGIVRGQYVQLTSIDLNGIRQKDVKAVIVQGSNVSLLGQPFLEQLDQITIKKGEMRLTPAAS